MHVLWHMCSGQKTACCYVELDKSGPKYWGISSALNWIVKVIKIILSKDLKGYIDVSV